MGANGKILSDAIDSIFSINNSGPQFKERSNKQAQTANINKRELEVAATVVLVDLASSDSGFEQREYHVIGEALRSLFGTSKDQIQGLVNQANLALKNLRGTNYYAKLLKENLEPAAKKALMEYVEDLIGADGIEDGFEIYLRKKIADSLGLDQK